MKVYGWTGMRNPSDFEEHFPETAEWRRQTREIVAARSKAEVKRLGGSFNLGETGNAAEIETALSEPGVIFWKPLDHRANEWARA